MTKKNFTYFEDKRRRAACFHLSNQPIAGFSFKISKIFYIFSFDE